MMSINTDQVAQALLIGLPSTILAYVTYKRARRVDSVAEQSGVAAESRAGTQQIIEGLNIIIDNLQEDNRQWREDAKYQADRSDARDKECNRVRFRLNAMIRKFGENGDNGKSTSDE
jgi:hypothetical protein